MINVANLTATLGLNAQQFLTGMSQATAAITKFLSAGGGIPPLMNGIASTFGGLQLAKVFDAATDALTDMIAEGTRFNSMVEQQKLGIAAIAAATGDIVDAQGRQLQGIEKIQAAQTITADLYRQIQKDAALTVATTEQLVGAFQQALGPARAAGLTLEQTRQVTLDIVLAWGAMGRPMHMVAQEARALLSGDIDRNAELAKALGITGEMVDLAKEQGKLYELLSQKLSIFRDAAGITANTFEGLLSTVKDLASILLGQAFTGVFNVVKDAVKDIRDYLITSTGQINPELVSKVETIGRVFAAMAKDMLTIARDMATFAGFVADVFALLEKYPTVMAGIQVAFKMLMGDAAGAKKVVEDMMAATQVAKDLQAKARGDQTADRDRMGFGGPTALPGKPPIDDKAAKKAAKEFESLLNKMHTMSAGLIETSDDIGRAAALGVAEGWRQTFDEAIPSMVSVVDLLAGPEVLDRALQIGIQIGNSVQQGIEQAAKMAPADTDTIVGASSDISQAAARGIAEANAAAATKALGDETQALADQLGDLYGQEQEALSAFIRTSSSGRLDAMRAEQDAIQLLMDQGLLNAEQTEDAKLRLYELSLEKRVLIYEQGLNTELEMEIAAQERINTLMESQVTQSQRHTAAMLEHQRLAATLSGDAWAAFTASFGLEVNSWGSLMQQWAGVGRQVAEDLHTAFADSFFALMKGDLESLDDIWDSFFDAIIMMMAEFLASAVVAEFFGFIAALGGLVLPSGTSSGGFVSSSGAPVSVAGVPLGSTGSSAGNAAANAVIGIGSSAALSAGSSYLAGLLGFGGAPAASAAAPVAASAMTYSTMGGTAVAAAPAAAAGATGSTTATMSATMAAIAPYAAMAAPLIPFVYGLLTSPSSSEKKDVQFANTVTEIAEFQNELIAGTLEPEQLISAVAAQQKFTTEFSGMGELPYLPDVTEITDPATIDRLEKFYGENAALVAESLLTNVVMIEEAFRQETAAIISGEQVVETTPMWTSTGSGDNGTQPVDMSGAYSVQASQILAGIPGIEAMDPAAMASFTNLMASFGDNEAAMVELIQSISEQLPEGMRLTTEEAAALVEQGKLATEEYIAASAAVAELSMALLDTTNGVGDMGQEALAFADALASGVYPAESLTGLFSALAYEHGPGFTEAVHAALIELGLTNEEAALLIDQMMLTTDGLTASVEQATLLGEALGEASEIEIVVPVSYEVVGDVPPGVETGSTSESGHAATTPAPSSEGPSGGPHMMDGRQHGGWVGGQGGVDSQMIWASPEEFVVKESVATRYGNFLERFNANPEAALASASPDEAAAILSALQDEEDTLLMREQNKLLKDIVRALTRGSGGGRLAGAVA